MKCITIKQPYASLIANGYKKYEFRTWRTKYEYLNLDYPQGQIIAKAEIIDCLEITKEVKEILKKEDKIVYQGAINHQGKNEYGFVLENIEKIKPIKAKGKLSLWDYKG